MTTCSSDLIVLMAGCPPDYSLFLFKFCLIIIILITVGFIIWVFLRDRKELGRNQPRTTP